MLRFLQCNDRIMKRSSSLPLSKKDRGSPQVSISENVLAKNKIISLGVGNLSGRKVSQLVQRSALLSGKVPVKHRCPQGLFVMGRYPHHFHTMSGKHGDIGPETGSIAVPVAKTQSSEEALDNCLIVDEQTHRHSCRMCSQHGLHQSFTLGSSRGVNTASQKSVE